MPRYNQCLAALRTIEGDFESSEKHYKRSLAVNPSDVMLRNDYSLQVGRQYDLPSPPLTSTRRITTDASH